MAILWIGFASPWVSAMVVSVGYFAVYHGSSFAAVVALPVCTLSPAVTEPVELLAAIDVPSSGLLVVLLGGACVGSSRSQSRKG